MRIAHVLWSLTYGGIETMLVNIANEQVRAGADVSVIVVNDLAEDALMQAFDKRIHYYCLRRKRHTLGLGTIVRLNRLLCRLQPDAIHLHSSRLYKMLLNKRLSRIASVTLHDLPKGSVRRGGMLHRLVPLLGLYDSNNVGDIDRVPRVFAISKAVGDELLGLESRIHFLGKKEQSYIADHLKDYDLFVQPSRYEGFGLTVAEAMAAGVPVLVSEGQRPAEVTCGSRYGWIFENGSVEALAQQLDFIATHYDDALAKARDARQHVVQTYDVSVTAKKYIEEYKKIIRTNLRRVQTGNSIVMPISSIQYKRCA